MPQPRVQAISFDAGGTLLYPYPSVGEIYSEVVAKHGVQIAPEILNEKFRRAWKQFHRFHRTGIHEESEKNWWREMVRETFCEIEIANDFEVLFEDLWVTFACPSRWKIFDGVIPTLGLLKSRGYRLILLSNWDRRLRALLDGLQLTDYFEWIVISSEVGFEKPDPRIFKYVEQKLALSGAQILHVGDSIYHDVEGARNAGWRWKLFKHSTEKTNFDVEAIYRFDEILDPRMD